MNRTSPTAVLWLLVLSWIAPAHLTRSVATPSDPPTLVLVVGAPGEPLYATNFVGQVSRWQQLAGKAGAKVVTVGAANEAAPAGEPEDRARLAATLHGLSEGDSPLWLVWIGHGTFDGKEAWFNLRGPDVSATEIAGWLKPIQRPLVVIHTASASGPFLPALSGTNRVVITATRSGTEQNVTRFGSCFVEALGTPAADLDVDQQVSLLEAFLFAARSVSDSYRGEGRLQTEHALLDDTGDRQGTPPTWYRGLQAIQKPKDGQAIDGPQAHRITLVPSPFEASLTPEFRARRAAMESRIAELRTRKASMSSPDYDRELETLLLELATLYQELKGASR